MNLSILKMYGLFILLLGFGLSLGTAVARAEVMLYPFDTELEELRFQSLLGELRCPKCQNQSLADSDAPIAKDLRQKIYELLKDGKSDQEIRNYLVQRYGDFISYRPPMAGSTVILWFAPFLLLMMSLLLAAYFLYRKQVRKRFVVPSEGAE